MNLSDPSRFYQDRVYYTQGILETMTAEFSRSLKLRSELSQKMHDALEVQLSLHGDNSKVFEVLQAAQDESNIAIQIINIDRALSELALAMTHTCNVANCNR